jgi:hypothetical protein
MSENLPRVVIVEVVSPVLRLRRHFTKRREIVSSTVPITIFSSRFSIRLRLRSSHQVKSARRIEVFSANRPTPR